MKAYKIMYTFNFVSGVYELSKEKRDRIENQILKINSLIDRLNEFDSFGNNDLFNETFYQEKLKYIEKYVKQLVNIEFPEDEYSYVPSGRELKMYKVKVYLHLDEET